MRQPAPTAQWLNDIVFTASGRGVIVGTGEVMLVSDDGGASWQKAPVRLADSLRALASRGAHVWGAGHEMIFSSADNGDTWMARQFGEKGGALADAGVAGESAR